MPDGSVIAFPSGGLYVMSRGIFLVNRHDLVFEGNGATIRASGDPALIASSPFLIDGGDTDIVVRGFYVEGNNPRSGSTIYNGAQENQQGIAVYGGLRIEVADNTIRHTHGDAVYVNEKDTTHTWSDSVWVHHNDLAEVGRIAFTMNGVRHALIERNTATNIGGAILDIEPDTTEQGATDVTLRYNTVGVYGMVSAYTQWFAASANENYGPGALVSGVTIHANIVTDGAPPSSNTPNAGGLAMWFGKTRTSHITVTDNTTTRAGIGPVFRFEHVDGLRMSGNVQPLVSGPLVYVFDCTDVVVQ